MVPILKSAALHQLTTCCQIGTRSETLIAMHLRASKDNSSCDAALMLLITLIIGAGERSFVVG